MSLVLLLFSMSEWIVRVAFGGSLALLWFLLLVYARICYDVVSVDQTQTPLHPGTVNLCETEFSRQMLAVSAEGSMNKGDTATAATERLDSVASVYSKDLAAIVENARWLVTLVLAEVAAIAGYRKLMGSDTLSIPFAIVILVLALSLLAFVISVIVARFRARNIHLLVAGCGTELFDKVNDPTVSDHQMSVDAPKIERATLLKLPTQMCAPTVLEMIDLSLMVFASVFAAVVVFLREFIALFGFRT